MIRALTTVAAIVALAVAAAPASAGSSKKPPPRTAQVVVLIGANDYGLTDVPDGTSNTTMRSGSRKPNGIIAILIG